MGPPNANGRIRPPQSWKTPSDHWKLAICDPWYRHLMQIQHELQCSIHGFFSSQGLIALLAPLTTGSISSPIGLGSDSLPVQVELFGIKTYLADSMQFMLEFGCRQHNKGVYYLMPSFRGEANDEYHLPQFFHAEAEIEGQLADVMRLASRLVHFVSLNILANARESVIALAGGVDHVERLLELDGKYTEIRVQEAKAELRSGKNGWIDIHAAGFEVITKAGEAELARRHGPVWLTHFDHCSVPFYQSFEDGTDQAMNADLILGSCETIGVGQRHATSADVHQALNRHKVDNKPYSWYSDMRDIAPMQTSGLGMGLERYLLWLLKHDDIRDFVFIYRENSVDVIP